MLGLDFLILLGVSLRVFPCEGAITSPSENEKYIFLPGQTANITWKFNDSPSSLVSRSWSFNQTDDAGPVLSLGIIFFDDKKPLRKTTLYDVDIVGPATLVLKNVNQSYDGFYSFSLTVIGNLFKRRVQVFIAMRPNVTFNVSSPVMVNSGDNFACLCKGEGGNPPANVTWRKVGENRGDVGIEEQTLEIRNAGDGDNGTYTCNATSYPNKNYTDEKSIEVIIVYITPNVTIDCSKASPIIVNEGADVTCMCKCEGGNPPANCSWFKDGTMKTGRIGKNDITLNLPDIKKTDSGNYTCVGESHPTALKKKYTTVTVHYVTVGFSSYPFVINESANITCTPSGPPLQHYIIYHNGSEVARNMRYNIPSVNWTHPGLYNCTATNNLGKLSDSRFLYVNKAEPTTQPIKSQYQPSMATNPAVITTCIPICTTTCNCPTTTSTPPASDGLGKSGSGTEWYIIVVSLASGIIFGILFSYIVSFSRRKLRGSQPQHSLYPKPGPPTSQIDSTYQELDLTRMNKEDNYQSLRGNAARNDGVSDNESNYAELNKTRELENNYQSLT